MSLECPTSDPGMHLYVITNTINGKKYVGITSRGIRIRFSHHCSPPPKGRKPTPLQRAIAKYGRESFIVEHVASAKNYDDLLHLERIVIAQENSIVYEGRGYNQTKGGEGMPGYRFSEEGRAAISERMKGNQRAAGKKLTEERKAKLSGTKKGERHTLESIAKMKAALANKGPLSEEHKAKIGAALKGQIIPAEIGRKISEAKKGIPQSDSHKKALSAARAGKPKSQAFKDMMREKMIAFWEAKKRNDKAA